MSFSMSALTATIYKKENLLVGNTIYNIMVLLVIIFESFF